MEKTEYVFGAGILDNLTVGMYKDAKIIFREYIQNACDQIDIARSEGLLHEKEERVDITIHDEERSISVLDNATGIPAAEFRARLGDIANSTKSADKDKGFRGIGRLAGLAYCKRMIYRTSVRGESEESIMICDAEKMRKMVHENEQGRKRYTAQEILQNIYSFEKKKTESGKHFFEVKLEGILPENDDLLNEKEVKAYLSFVAPVPFINTFYLREKIYNYAKENNFFIDEYRIFVNGEQLFKNYRMNYKVGRGGGDDSLYDCEFMNLKGDNGDILAWMWFGDSYFKGALPDDCTMRGIRLRTGNIQIGDETTMQEFFSELRGNKYFVGEVYTVSKELMPNARRDYFNRTKTVEAFEHEIRTIFSEKLSPLYHAGSNINGLFKKKNKYENDLLDFERQNIDNTFIDNADRMAAKDKIDEEKKQLDKNEKELNKYITNANPLIEKMAKKRYEVEKENEEKNRKDNEQINTTKKCGKNGHRSARLSKLDRKTQKIVERIYKVVNRLIDDKELKERIIQGIEDELK